MAQFLKLKVCSDQPNTEFSNDKKLGMIVYIPIDRFAENIPFEEVF